MQNYGQTPVYQRPGSTASFAGQPAAPPPPPAYGGYQSAAPQQQSQWGAPVQQQAPNQQWSQPQQQAASGYNPNTYGAMPGGQQAYPPQQHDQPPPPPPKPYGFAGAVQQQNQQQQQQQQQQQYNQGWNQQPQQNTSQTPQQQGGYPVPGGGQAQQQPYNNAAPPPPSATPGGSYFPPAQGGRPGSIYGANQIGSAGPPQPSTVVSPNEQQPAYIPPSLTGQGVQAYMPSNTNPMPGVYVPPPPDIPAWQQAQHAPLQGGNKKFKYTKPTVDPSFYAQGYQGVQPMQQQPALPPRPPEYHTQSPMQPHPPQQLFQQQQYQQQVPQGQPPNQVAPPPPQPAPGQQYNQQQQAPLGQHAQSQPFGQPQHQYNQQPTQQQQPINQGAQASHQQQCMPPTMGYGASNVSKPVAYEQVPGPGPSASNVSKPFESRPQQPQWPPQPQGAQGYGPGEQNAQPSYNGQQQQQQQWQPGHQQTQSSLSSIGQQYNQGAGQDIEAPKPISRTDTASSTFFNQPSPQSTPVSPVNNRQSMSFASGHQVGLGRTGSVSSVALSNLHAQREGNRTSSPKPAPPKLPTPPPPRDDKSKFSALGSGGPSDWEHFGGEDEIDDEEIFAKKKNEPVQLDSVELPADPPELPAGPSPPSTHGWPSPATQPPALHTNARQDTYQPTPPPTVAQLAQPVSSASSQKSFVMGDAAPAPLRLSPKPLGGSRPPSTQQKSVMGDSAWQPPKQGTSVQHQPQHAPPSASQGFVMDDGGWAAQPTSAQERQPMPAQNQQPSVMTGGFVMGDIDRNGSQRTPTQERSSWVNQPTHDHSAELKTKDDAFEYLKADSMKEKAVLQAEIEKLKADFDVAKAHVADEKAALEEQIEVMNRAAEESKVNADAQLKAIKEKDLTIERLKEDVEGKEHNIEERDATIAELRRELEAEKTKEHPKPTPVAADLIPEINPWYAGSLERYIAMLRGEAHEPEVEDKIKTFKAFLKAESEIRGIPYFDAPPPVPQGDQVAQLHPTPDTASNTSKVFNQSEDLDKGQVFLNHGEPNVPKPLTHAPNLNINVPQESPDAEDYDYSPGGRPVLKRKSTIPSNEERSFPQHSNTSAQSTTILTPASSVDNDSSTTPVQSPPEVQPQTQYKAYVPPAAISSEAAPLAHRQSMSFSNITPVGTTSSLGKSHDEIFFGAHEPETSKSPSRPSTSDKASPEVPAPLNFASTRATSTAPPSRNNSAETLAHLLPAHIAPTATSHFIEDIRSKLAQLKQGSSNIDDLTKAWDKTASLMRRKNDDARRKRQEEQEENNDDAFNNNEISYADLNVLEEEFKQKEGELKAQEDRDEYKSYVEAVFDNVYDDLQTDIKGLMDLYVEAESLLHTSVSGVRSLEGGDAASTQDCLELLKQLHERIRERQDKVVQAVAERDKRYKKTEIQPLYAAGNITKMKNVEKHFENAEKQAILRAKRDTAGRVGELVSIAEEVVVNAVGIEQHEIDGIITALRDLEGGSEHDKDLVTRAHNTVAHLKASSKSLLSLLNTMELDLNNAVSDAELAQAKAENADAASIKQLGSKKEAEEKKLKEEFERKLQVLEHDKEEIEALVEDKGGKVELTEEQEKEKRLRAALEAAKKRNGHA